MRLFHVRNNTLKKVIFVILVLGIVIAAGATVFCGLGLYGFPQQPHFKMNDGDQTLMVRGAKIRYREKHGSGPPVIFVHGNNLSLDDWGGVIDNIEEKGRRLIALDLIGFAGSGRPDLSYSLECHRIYLTSFMDALKIEKAILVGHSMGGAIVAWTTANSKDRVIASVLISLPGIPGSLVYAWPKNLICQPGYLNRAAFLVANSALFKTIFPLSLARQTLGVTNTYNSGFAEALRRIHQPVLLLMSPGDKRISFEYSKEYQKRIDNIESVDIPASAGHMAPRTYPSGTAALISKFLRKIDSKVNLPD